MRIQTALLFICCMYLTPSIFAAQNYCQTETIERVQSNYDYNANAVTRRDIVLEPTGGSPYRHYIIYDPRQTGFVQKFWENMIDISSSNIGNKLNFCMRCTNPVPQFTFGSITNRYWYNNNCELYYTRVY